MKPLNKIMVDQLIKNIALNPALKVQIQHLGLAVQALRGPIQKLSVNTLSGLKKDSKAFIQKNRSYFNSFSTSGLQLLLEGEDINNGKAVTWQQYHGKAKVEGASIRFHSNAKGIIDSITNYLFHDLSRLPSSPKISEAKALELAQKTVKCYEEPSQTSQLVVIRYKELPYLAWKIELRETTKGGKSKIRTDHSILTHEHGAPHIWIVYVNAISNKVIYFYDNVQTAGPTVGAGTGYYSGGGALNTYYNDITYQLRDLTRTGAGGSEIRTDDEDGTSPSSDPDNNWNTVTTSPRDSNQGAEVDAHRYTGKVYDYYQTVHSRNGFNGTGGLFRIVSHLGSNYNNGYWDGDHVNLGDGTGVAATGDDYECSDDWLAHEWTHAYTQFTCGLQYLNEAGALNEAFSDIMAAFITGDWLVFEDAWLKASAPASRNMIDPTNGGMWNVADPITSVLAGHQPSHYTTRYIGGSDNGGVHINSGIINNLFYLLTVGGTHTLSGVAVTGIGQSAAEQLLWKCMSDNLVGHSTATFLDFRQAMLDACLELFPTDLVKLSQVKNAFHAVGIGPDLFVRDNLADSGTEPFGGSYLWASPDIINRKIAVSNPVVAFADLTNDSLWENVEYGQNNFVYVRVQNRGDVAGDTTVNVYMSGATTFGTPASWIHVGSTLVTSVAPGTMKVSNAITFPSALIPAPGHYCMIAVFSSPLDPAPDHSLITSVSQYLDFVRNTNNIAYRNMDVENMVPGVPGSYGVVIQNMKDQPEYYDLKIDLRRFVPGVKLLLKGDRKFLDGAIPQGLKLIAREKNINVYQLLQGNNYFKNRLFIGACENIHALEHGFRNVLVDRPFKLEVIYQVDEDFQIQRNENRIYELQIQQFWKGENVGAAGIRLQAVVGKKKS